MTNQTPPAPQRPLQMTGRGQTPPPQKPSVRGKPPVQPAVVGQAQANALARQNMLAWMKRISSSQLELVPQDPRTFNVQRPGPRRAYPVPPGFDTPQNDPSDLPNYEKLSWAERHVMGAVPGISNALSPFTTPLGQAYKKWDATWYGSAVNKSVGGAGGFAANLLSVLDLGAEALERGTGLAAQWLEVQGDPARSEEFDHNIKAAWYAGSLAADAADLWGDPELGGVDVLVKSRQKIATLMARGMSAHDALIQTRNEYHASLGALAIRAQLHDLAFHVLADPLNYVLPMIKPIERAQALRKVLVGVEATAGTVSDLRKTASAAEGLLDAAKLAGKTVDEISAAEKFAVSSRRALAAAERTRLSPGQQKMLSLIGLGNRGRGAKAIVALTGGDELGDAVKGGLPGLLYKANPFNLTPESRAHEYLTVLHDNLTAYVDAPARLADGTPDIEQAIRTIVRATDGLTDPKMGAMITSQEGRMIWAGAVGFKAKAEEINSAYKAMQLFETPLLREIASATGDDVYKVIGRLAGGENVGVLDQLTRAMAVDPEMALRVGELLAKNGIPKLTPDTLARLGITLEDTRFAGYTPDLALKEINIALTDHMAQVAIRKFGVQARGAFTAAANVLKAAETLGFLRLNPTYPIRNFFNNFVTMVGRDVWGGLSEKGIKQAWKNFGFEPSRLKIGVTAGEITLKLAEGADISPAAAALGEASRKIGEATRATGGPGKLFDKTTDALRRLPLGKGDMGQWAAKIEQAASERAYTTSFLRAYPQFVRQMLPNLYDFEPGIRNVLGRESADTLFDKIVSFTNDGQVDDLLKGSIKVQVGDSVREVADNLNISMAGIVRRAEHQTGMTISHVIPEEVQARIAQALHDAALTGDRALVHQAALDAVDEAQAHIDDLVNMALKDMREEAAAKVQVEGPQAYVRYLSEFMDGNWKAEAAHHLDMMEFQDTIIARGGGGREAVNLAWRERNQVDTHFFANYNKTSMARLDGVMQGAKAAGLPGSEQVNAAWKQIRGEWNGFMTFRRGEWAEYFDSLIAGKPPRRTFDAIFDDLQTRYAKLSELEYEAQGKIDQLVGDMLNEQQKAQYLAGREAVNKMRLVDKNDLLIFREQVRHMRPEDRREAFKAFTKQRIETLGKVADEESKWLAAMQGSPEARQATAAQTEMQQIILDEEKARAAEGLAPVVAETPPNPQLEQINNRIDAILDGEPEKFTGEMAALMKQADALQTAENNAARAIKSNIIQMQRTEMPKELDDAFGDFAKYLQREVGQGEQGELIPRPDAQPGDAPIVIPTTNALIVQELSRKFNMSRNPILAALKRLEQDAGKDKGKGVKRVKAYIIKLWTEGNPIDGTPPEPELLWALGRKEEAIAAAQKWAEAGIEPTFPPGTFDEFLKPAEQAVNPPLTLPPELAKAAPRYGYGKRNFQLVFENDVDRALYTIANPKTNSKAQPQFMAYLKAQFPDKSEAEIRALGQAVKNRIKAAAKSAEAGVEVLSIKSGSMPSMRQVKVMQAEQPSVKIVPEAETARAHLPDMNKLVPDQMFPGEGLAELFHTKGRMLVRQMEQATYDLMDRPPLRWADLPAEFEPQLRNYAETAKGAMADARYASMRFAEYGRDSALLNYSRRMNYDAWLGNIVPYEFWATHSAAKWALHSLDRPAMLTTYLRMRKFMDTAYKPVDGRPSRFKGMLKIPMPFLPEWMGNSVYVNPMNLALPFDSWAAPLDRYAQDQQGDIGATNRVLEGLYNDGKISQAEFNDAMQTQSGPAWERAQTLARQDDTEGRMNWGDVAAQLLPPHIPILYAMDQARGKNPFEERGPILPLTRSLGNILSTLGVDPASALNPEAAIRKWAGLHPFGKWDDYYAERMLTNMVAMGEMSVTEARDAMTSHNGPAWDKAVQRAGVEKAGGSIITAAMALGGLPAKGYPPGEEYLRSLKDEYNAAWDAYDKSGGDYKATVGKFVDAHPGYEERLALFKKPEERLQQFMTDEFWGRWTDLPKLTKDELKDGLGQDLEHFVSQTTPEVSAFRKNVPNETLAYWLKLMGGTPPGTLSAAGGPGSLPDLQTTDPEIAQRAQVFYDTRQSSFPNALQAQDAYFTLPQGVERKKYLASNPVLKSYWDWRRTFLQRNGDLAPYLTDNPKDLPERPVEFRGQPTFSRIEWQAAMGLSLYHLALDMALGEDMPPGGEDALLRKAAGLGIYATPAEIAEMVAAAP